ncbi:MAG: HEAT repeat domain-containing protein [Pyrinomonadaceae bacterium]|nr:HEAT repeat domain-containing protein [Pyrinomonadaceae bacterium]MCX7640737.1 HEAT repeat domain-containing protein [Pyrinomonadaceae bacterium]MDW8304632.1 HEAT repeat domain-containing protein [Acidobacteriota bacterium]
MIKIFTKLSFLLAFYGEAYSQAFQQEDPQQSFWWYVIILLLLLAALGTVLWAMRLRKETEKLTPPKSKTIKTTPVAKEPLQETPIKTKQITRKAEVDINLLLPVFLTKSLPSPKPLTPLPTSNDEGLLSAIEEVETQGEDEELRLLSLKVLAAFKTRNSVEALEKIIRYDPSDEMKIKAIQILTEFNHDSVFEPILIACADSSKRVRAAAVQALSRLNIDRTEAWMRIVQSDDPDRLKLAARAVVESGFADKVFERLISKDFKQANEAIALIALLIKADETTIIFRRLSEEKNQILQKAILHVVKLTNSEKALGGLYLVLEKGELTEELKQEIDEIIEHISLSLK